MTSRAKPSKKRPNEDAPSASQALSIPKKTKKTAGDDEDDWDGTSAVKEKPKGAANFYKFKQREAPQALGSKEIPEGPEDCLTGLDFVITGVLDSIQREDAEDFVKRHGGQVKSGVSKKTSYLVTGREPGESKLKKAKDLQTKIIDEDGLFDLVRNAGVQAKPAASTNRSVRGGQGPLNGSAKGTISAKPAAKKPKAEIFIVDSDDDDIQPVPKKLKKDAPVSPPKRLAPIFNIKPRSGEKPAAGTSSKPAPTAASVKQFPSTTTTKADIKPVGKPKPEPKPEPSSPSKAKRDLSRADIKAGQSQPSSSVAKHSSSAVKTELSRADSVTAGKAGPAPAKSSSSMSSQSPSSTFSASPAAPSGVPFVLWVDKYAPTTLKGVVGQHGPASPANKLVHWLTHWHNNRKKNGYKAVSAGFFPKKGGDGGEFKAVLLSGPPGLGKTTTAILACKETGFTFVHLNASDSRSKKLLDDRIMGTVGSHSLLEYFSPDASRASDREEKSVLIMDEVDGMAGNEDRGGMAEVIQLIKNARVPVICICNDRSSQKIRSLAAYCYDLRFSRPRLEQIRGAMMTVCAREGIKMPSNALDAIIQGANQDIRQTLHNLYTWTISKKTMTYDEAKVNSTMAEKDSIKVGPFDVCRDIFKAPSGKYPNSLVQEKMDLYFEDYNFVPLFIQENYLNVTPHRARNDHEKLDLISQAADSLSLSDLIDREIRGRQNWSLLPIHAVFAAVIPGNVMQGHLQSKIEFPAWLGKNSTTNKNKRIIEDLRAHMHLRISANVTGLNLDYLPVMRRALTLPLKQGDEGIEQVVNFVNSYDLLREDIEPIMDVTTWDGMKDPLKDIPPAVKSALTRQLNKGDHQNPYSTSDVKKGRAKATDGVNELLDEEAKAALATPDDDEDPAATDNDNVDKDPMIKAKKPRAAPGTAKPRGGVAAGSDGAKSARGGAAAGTSRGGTAGRGKTAAASGSRRGKK